MYEQCFSNLRINAMLICHGRGWRMTYCSGLVALHHYCTCLFRSCNGIFRFIDNYVMFVLLTLRRSCNHFSVYPGMSTAMSGISVSMCILGSQHHAPCVRMAPVKQVYYNTTKNTNENGFHVAIFYRI